LKRIATIALLLIAQNVFASEDSLPGALEAGWQGQKVCELLHEDEMIRTLRCTFPPGVGHERHYHPPHFGYTLKGGGTMRITDASGDREISGKPGGTWVSEGVPWHKVINISETTTQYLIVEKKY
jgi:quercetin dioxygenase-like cupin family protein